MLRTAARSMAASKGIRDVDALALRMMQDTVTALRIFVNDGINELQFTISAVAQNMLRPGKGSIIDHRHCPRSLSLSLMWDMSHTHDFNDEVWLR